MAKLMIISGGQTGADQGGLVAAKQLGIPTGGFMPRGFLTEAGPCPELGPLYGLCEHKSTNYKIRTRMNVRQSDATAWFGTIGSQGYRATVDACYDYEKPFCVIQSASDLREFIDNYNVRILNVAGNRASVNPDIHRFTAETIIEALQERP